MLAIVRPELIPALLLLTGQVLTGLSAAQLAIDATRKATGQNVTWATLTIDALGALPGITELAKPSPNSPTSPPPSPAPHPPSPTPPPR